MIVCCDEKNGIGKENTLPWNIPSEMKLFKEKTIGNGSNCVVMGKNTFLSIPKKYRPLKQRHNVIITQDDGLREQYREDPNVTFIQSPDDIIIFSKLTVYDEYWLIGGKMLYDYFLQHYLKYISELHISILPHDYGCDTFLSFKQYRRSFLVLKETNYKLFKHQVWKNQDNNNTTKNTDCL